MYNVQCQRNNELTFQQNIQIMTFVQQMVPFIILQTPNKQLRQIYSMDPRPYHYEYRRPRYQNRTFESTNLFESIYHTRGAQRIQQNSLMAGTGASTPRAMNFRQNYDREINANRQDPKAPSNTHIKRMSDSDLNIRMNSHDKSLSNSALYRFNPQSSSPKPTADRPNSNRSTQSKQVKYQHPSILSTYGRHSMMQQQSQNNKSSQQQSKMSNSVFPELKYDHLNRFTIYQKQQKPYNIVDNRPRETSSDLRKYPKMSLQDRLIETGRYAPKY